MWLQKKATKTIKMLSVSTMPISAMIDNNTVLTVENIHKNFNGQEVLKGVSLTANKGDVISILGSSGSGKSTFLRCINLLEEPEEGSIQVGDQKVICRTDGSKKQKTEKKVIDLMRTQLGMVFQSFNLWSHMTVLENVMEGPIHVLKREKQEVREEALAYLKKVGMENKVNCFPSELSGGQQQRVAIARALAMNPQVLLFDEPTSALDPELVGEVLLVIKELAKEGRTMLVVTHEMNFARDVSNRVVFLNEGRIEVDDTPFEFFENNDSVRVREFLSKSV